MCSLATFQQPPPDGYVTVCERNGELISGRDMQAHLDTYSKSLDSRSANVKESARSAFLEHDDTLRQKLLRAWYEHGLAGMAEVISSMDEKEKGGAWLPGVASRILAGIRWASALHGSLFPHLSMSGEELIMEFSPNRDWRDSIVRCLDWHPHTAKYAVALRDDSIRVHTDRKHDIIPILKHKLQRGIADLTWRPASASVLAVACQSCILIWHVDPTSLATRPSTSSVQVLSQQGHSPVTSVAWYPRGGTLVSGSPTDTAVMVWDVAMETCVPLRRVGGGGVSLLSWSPDGSKLLSACPSPVFRVWECRWWTSQKWSKLFSRCQSACWSPDGSTLLFATEEEPTIYSLSFSKMEDERKPSIGGSKAAVSCVDISEVEVETEEGSVRIGGTVQAMAWDPTGERLAVQFRGSAGHLVALFQTRLHPILEVIPCGFVQGDPGAFPNLISFQKNFRQGALLTVVWSTGKIAFIPLHFLPREAVEHHQVSLDGNVNGHVSMTGLYSAE